MKTTAMILCAILWIAGIAQQTSKSGIFVPMVKVKSTIGSGKNREVVCNAVRENSASSDIFWTMEIWDNPVPENLSPQEDQALMEEMFQWYDLIKTNKMDLNFAQKVLFENQLNALVGRVMKNEIEMARKRFNLAQRWCDSVTRYMGLPSEICMDVLRKSRQGYAAGEQLFLEANSAHQPEIRLGILQNALDRMNQSLLWQEMAILEIHQYEKSSDTPTEHMMVTDDSDW